MVGDIAVGAEGLGLIPRTVRSDTMLSTAAVFLRSCVVQAQSRIDGSVIHPLDGPVIHPLRRSTASVMKIEFSVSVKKL